MIFKVGKSADKLIWVFQRQGPSWKGRKRQQDQVNNDAVSAKLIRLTQNGRHCVSMGKVTKDGGGAHRSKERIFHSNLH